MLKTDEARVELHGIATAGAIRVATADLATGVYHLRLITGGGNVSVPFVVVR